MHKMHFEKCNTFVLQVCPKILGSKPYVCDCLCILFPIITTNWTTPLLLWTHPCFHCLATKSSEESQIHTLLSRPPAAKSCLFHVRDVMPSEVSFSDASSTKSWGLATGQVVTWSEKIKCNSGYQMLSVQYASDNPLVLCVCGELCKRCWPAPLPRAVSTNSHIPGFPFRSLALDPTSTTLSHAPKSCAPL